MSFFGLINEFTDTFPAKMEGSYHLSGSNFTQEIKFSRQYQLIKISKKATLMHYDW